MQGNLIGLSINGFFVSCEIQCEFNFDVEMRGASAVDSGRWKEVIPGIRSWGMSVNGKLLLNTVPADFKSILYGALMTGERVLLKWATRANDDFVISGYAYPNSGSINAARNETVNWNLSFTGSGALNPSGVDPIPGDVMRYGYVDFDPTTGLDGVSDLLQFNRPIYPGETQVILDFTQQSAGYWLVVEDVLTQPVFNKWDNNSLNFGDIPDFSWATPIEYNGNRYYYTTKREYITGINSSIRFSLSNSTKPIPFVFDDVYNALPSTEYISNQVTISGITEPVSVDIYTGTGTPAFYKINGGAWVSDPGMINNNDTLRLKLTSGNGIGTNKTKSMTVTVGGVSDIWVVTTEGS